MGFWGLTGVFGDKVGAAGICGAGVVVACVRAQIDATAFNRLRHKADRFENRGLVGAEGTVDFVNLIGQTRGDFVDALVFSGFGDFLENSAQFVTGDFFALDVHGGNGIDGGDVFCF